MENKVRVPRSFWKKAPIMMVILIFILSSTSCGLLGTDDTTSMDETKIALDVQSTFDAERAATLNAQQTEMAAAQTSAASGAGEQVPEAEVEATSPPEAVAPTDTVPPTEAPAPTETMPPIPSEITNWEMENFQEVDSGCRFEDMACWQGTSGDKILISEESFYIDPNWPDPHLVYWSQYQLPGNTDGDVSVMTDYDWVRLYYFDGQSAWKQVTLSLKDYVGETISIRFYMPFGMYETKVKCDKVVGVTYDCQEVQVTVDSDWSIQNIQIVPDLSEIQ